MNATWGLGIISSTALCIDHLSTMCIDDSFQCKNVLIFCKYSLPYFNPECVSFCVDDSGSYFKMVRRCCSQASKNGFQLIFVRKFLTSRLQDYIYI